jgi:uncharacterized protein (DUF362 family)
MKYIYTNSGTNIKEMTLELLYHSDPVKNTDKDILFGIKPNLVCPKDASTGATTHVEIAEGIIVYLLDKGCRRIKILESSWVGGDTKEAFDVCGYMSLSKKYGVELSDLKDDISVEKEYREMKIKVCGSVFDIDYLINVPLVKGHCQTGITCALKNLKGLIPDDEKRRFHSLGLHKPIAYLNKIIRQDLIIADAICPDPNFEEGGDPKHFNRIFLADDPVLMDSYAAMMLGYKAEDIGYLKLAHDEGIGDLFKSDSQLVDLDKNSIAAEKSKMADDKYLNMISEADACSHCYSNLASALRELHKEGLDLKLADQICIGQAYRGHRGVLGIGDCTSEFSKHLHGCPPTIEEIVEHLKEYGESGKLYV